MPYLCFIVRVCAVFVCGLSRNEAAPRRLPCLKVSVVLYLGLYSAPHPSPLPPHPPSPSSLSIPSCLFAERDWYSPHALNTSPPYLPLRPRCPAFFQQRYTSHHSALASLASLLIQSPAPPVCVCRPDLPPPSLPVIRLYFPPPSPPDHDHDNNRIQDQKEEKGENGDSGRLVLMIQVITDPHDRCNKS